MHPQVTRCGFPRAGSSSDFGRVAEVLVLAVPGDCHRCTSQVGLDCSHGATRGAEGNTCPHMCLWEALCTIIFISWQVDWSESKRLDPDTSPSLGPLGNDICFPGSPSLPCCHSCDLHKGPRSRSETLQLGFNWFLSIKLNSDNRLISAVKCLKFLTTRSIRWRKHNSV